VGSKQRDLRAGKPKLDWDEDKREEKERERERRATSKPRGESHREAIHSNMIWPQQPRRRAHHQWLLPLCLLLAFQQTIKRADAVQQANEQRGDQEPGSAIQSAPLMSMGSESSSALESSAALAGDDLIAAESSQSPDSAEHKSFTSAQVVRQVSFRHCRPSSRPAPPD